MVFALGVSCVMRPARRIPMIGVFAYILAGILAGQALDRFPLFPAISHAVYLGPRTLKRMLLSSVRPYGFAARAPNPKVSNLAITGSSE